MPAIEKFVRILATTVPAFFPREKPISRNAKPACMNMTTIAATITQVELMPTVSGSLPLPAASKVSAIADAGNASAASRPSGSARLKGVLLVGEVDRSVGPPVQAVFVPVSKIAKLVSAIRSRLSTAGETAGRAFGHADRVRGPSSSYR